MVVFPMSELDISSSSMGTGGRGGDRARLAVCLDEEEPVLPLVWKEVMVSTEPHCLMVTMLETLDVLAELVVFL